MRRGGGAASGRGSSGGKGSSVTAPQFVPAATAAMIASAQTKANFMRES
jgi:hypothetical protein